MSDDATEASARDKVQRGLTESNIPLEWSEASCLLRRLDESRAERDDARGERDAYMASYRSSQEEAVRLREQFAAARLEEIARLRPLPHPWYGPCDALGPNGECAECLKLRAPPGADAVAICEAVNKAHTDEIMRYYVASATVAELQQGSAWARSPE